MSMSEVHDNEIKNEEVFSISDPVSYFRIAFDQIFEQEKLNVYNDFDLTAKRHFKNLSADILETYVQLFTEDGRLNDEATLTVLKLLSSQTKIMTSSAMPLSEFLNILEDIISSGDEILLKIIHNFVETNYSLELDEITDNYQKMWKCVDNGGKIVVKSLEVENVIILKYEPLMTTITIKYMDSESNELMEPKKKTMQVGSTYKDRPIEKFTSNDGKQWKIDLDKIEEFVAKRYEEENVFSIYYDKENTKVTLAFYDAYNNKLKADQEVDWQIGAKLETKIFERITDDKGQRWMIESSEPKNLIVKENNNYVKLIYGEVKAKVLVKHRYKIRQAYNR